MRWIADKRMKKPATPTKRPEGQIPEVGFYVRQAPNLPRSGASHSIRPACYAQFPTWSPFRSRPFLFFFACRYVESLFAEMIALGIIDISIVSEHSDGDGAVIPCPKSTMHR